MKKGQEWQYKRVWENESKGYVEAIIKATKLTMRVESRNTFTTTPSKVENQKFS